MKNLFLLLRRFSNLILFIGLEVVCMVLISRTNSLQGNDVLSAANTVSGFFYQKQNDVVQYFALRRAADSLLTENVRLHNQIDALTKSRDTLQDTTVVVTVPPPDSLHTIQYAHYVYRSARVINNSVTQKNNFITIARGTDDGIRKDMPVITSSGIVGRVVNTSDHFATILSALSEKSTVSARLRSGFTSSVSWKSGSPDVLQMVDVAAEEKVNRGDSVFASSYSAYPTDALIGVVVKIETVKRTGKRILSLRPGAPFRALQHVYVVENTFADEQRKLEDSTRIQNTLKPR